MRAPLIARAFASSARAPASRRGASSSILAALLERTPLRALVDDVARDDDDDGANANDANANDDDDANASAYRASLPTVVVRGVRGKTPMTEHVARTIASLRRAPVVLTPSSSRAVDERGLLGRRLADVPRVSVRVGTTARALAMACDDARRVAASTATATASTSTSASPSPPPEAKARSPKSPSAAEETPEPEPEPESKPAEEKVESPPPLEKSKKPETPPETPTPTPAAAADDDDEDDFDEDWGMDADD